MTAGSPGELRQMMVDRYLGIETETDIGETDFSDQDTLLALRSMDAETLQAALDLMDDDMCARIRMLMEDDE